MTEQRDRSIRAITNDGAFRVITIRSTDTAQKICRIHGVTGEEAERFAEVITGSVLVRQTMAPTYRVQVVLRLGEHGHALADSHPEGLTRGVITRDDESVEITLGGESILQVIRVLRNGDLHQAYVSTDARDGISVALATYMLQSEQVDSTIAVDAVVDGDRVIAAGGYIMQLLPEAEPEAIDRMREHLRSYWDIREKLTSTDADPEDLMRVLLGDIPYTLLEEDKVFAGCICSEVRVIGALATLGRPEIEDIVARGETLDIGCDFCGTRYPVSPRQIASLLEQT